MKQSRTAEQNDRLWESTPPHQVHLGPPTLELCAYICITQNLHLHHFAGNIVAIAISQAIADVGQCFVLRLRLRLTLRVRHSPLSSHICPIILSAAPMGCPTIPTIGWWGALLPAPLLSTGFRRRATVCCASYKFSDGVIEAAAEEEQPCPCSAPNIWVPAPLSAPVAI